MAEDEPAAEHPEIILRQEQIGGVWANFAQVSHSQHEFTIDFVRMDSTAPPPGRGIVVARVSMSPLFVTQLIDALQKNWSGYAQKALPKEARDEPEPEEREPGLDEPEPDAPGPAKPGASENEPAEPESDEPGPDDNGSEGPPGTRREEP